MNADPPQPTPPSEQPPAKPKPAGPNIRQVMMMLDQLFLNLGDTVDSCDAHFLQNPVDGRALSEQETAMVMNRRHALAVVRHVASAADIVLRAASDDGRASRA